ncbi:hypothetical protein A2U01_0014628, partial [Trifolium medium]|nr:hypothetical protein [Trifolium medium]
AKRCGLLKHSRVTLHRRSHHSSPPNPNLAPSRCRLCHWLRRRGVASLQPPLHLSTLRGSNCRRAAAVALNLLRSWLTSRRGLKVSSSSAVYSVDVVRYCSSHLARTELNPDVFYSNGGGLVRRRRYSALSQLFVSFGSGSLRWFEFIWLERAVYACCDLS